MNEQETLKILQHYRHDVSNHLQLISGYLAMNRTRLAEEKLDNWVQLLNEERKLINLQVPAFALYLIRFNSLYSQMRMNYKVLIDKIQISDFDRLLYTTVKTIVNRTIDQGLDEDYFDVQLILSLNEFEDIQVDLSINGGSLTNNEISTIIQDVPKELNVKVEVIDANVKYSYILPNRKR